MGLHATRGQLIIQPAVPVAAAPRRRSRDFPGRPRFRRRRIYSYSSHCCGPSYLKTQFGGRALPGTGKGKFGWFYNPCYKPQRAGFCSPFSTSAPGQNLRPYHSPYRFA